MRANFLVPFPGPSRPGTEDFCPVSREIIFRENRKVYFKSNAGVGTIRGGKFQVHVSFVVHLNTIPFPNVLRAYVQVQYIRNIFLFFP